MADSQKNKRKKPKKKAVPPSFWKIGRQGSARAQRRTVGQSISEYEGDSHVELPDYDY